MKIRAGEWPHPAAFGEILECQLNEAGVITIAFDRDSRQTRTIKTGDFKPQKQAVLEAFQR